jgi:hypothetical protein
MSTRDANAVRTVTEPAHATPERDGAVTRSFAIGTAR